MSVINTNVAANNTYRLMSMASEEKASSMEKLSSGLRINRAADDAAGLSIAEGLRSQANGLEVASRNIGDAVSLAQTAEGGLSVAHDILQRMRDLAVQAGNDTNNIEARDAIESEVKALAEELVRMSKSIEFNNQNLLGDASGSTGDGAGIFTFQVGANDTNDQIKLDLSGANLKEIVGGVAAPGGTLGLSVAADGTVSGVDTLLANATAASTFITKVDTAIQTVSEERSNIGAVQNRLEHTLKHVNVTAENLTNAESRIRDVDMAKEIVKQSAANIKEQASQAMLAQANQASQGVLQLLR